MSFYKELSRGNLGFEKNMPHFGYKRMFDNLPAHDPEPEALNDLATIMSGRVSFLDAEPEFVEAGLMVVNDADHASADAGPVFQDANAASGTPRAPKAKPKPIPAGYTYLAQFITHDISFDEHSNRHLRGDLPFFEIATPEFIRNLKNLRKPNFDLETIYGQEIPANPGEIPRHALRRDNNALLKLGSTAITSDPGRARISFPNDLPRGNACVEARIVDPRNDENVLVAQTQVAFIKFHNAMVVRLKQTGKVMDSELFEKARRLTIRYYQAIILTDFLPRIIPESILGDAIDQVRHQKTLYNPDMFIPLEFSVAAFRFGHSMIRQEYNLNAFHIGTSPHKIVDESAKLDELMRFTGRGEMSFRNSPTPEAPLLRLPSIWIPNWNLFFETDGVLFTSAETVKNLAEPINTRLALALLQLRPGATGVPTDGRPNSIAAIDLFRGRRFGLPAGQDVARKIGRAAPLSADQIANLISRADVESIVPGDDAQIKQAVINAFSERSPLWFYVLAEAEIQNDGKLGEVGGRIVAETMIQLLYNSEFSILCEDWDADEGFLLKDEKFSHNPNMQTFGMPEMLNFIKKMGEDHLKELYPERTEGFDELNPLGDPQ